MAGTINKEHLKKIIQAWNDYDATREDDNFFTLPKYKGLSLSFKADEWREDHPQEFPEFCKLKREHSRAILRRYDCREWHLPESIIKMVVEHEVTYEEIAEFITLLLKKRDTISEQVILPLP